MDQQDFASSKLFFDNKNFPRGFARSGVFSKKESDILESCGAAMREIVEQLRDPSTDAECQFFNMILTSRDPQTDVERTWNKYSNYVGTRRVSYTTGLAPNTVSDGYDYSETDTD